MQVPPPPRTGPAEGHFLLKATLAGLVLAAGWLLHRALVVAPSHGAHGHPIREPVPGVRTTTWKRARDLPPRVEPAPADLAGMLDVAVERPSHHEVRLRLSLPREAAARRRVGSLLIHHGIETDPPVRLVWYLRR